MPLARVRATACVARARDADARRARDGDVFQMLDRSERSRRVVARGSRTTARK